LEILAPVEQTTKPVSHFGRWSSGERELVFTKGISKENALSAGTTSSD
jgi:hypothetical protein